MLFMKQTGMVNKVTVMNAGIGKGLLTYVYICILFSWFTAFIWLLNSVDERISVKWYYTALAHFPIK